MRDASALPTIVAPVTRSNLRVTILGLNYAPELSGNAPYTTRLAEGLREAGHSVHVVAGYPHYPEWVLRKGYSGWKRQEVINGVPVKRLRHYVPQKPSFIARLHLELSFGCRLVFTSWYKPDVVLVVSPALFSCALAILRVRVQPTRPAVGIWVQDLYSRGVVETGSKSGFVSRILTLLESLILRAADCVVAIHDRFKHHMVNELSVPGERISVIRNWTHLPASPKTGHQEIRQKLGWKTSDIIVLHAGNMGMKQGLENVVEAARLASQQESKVRFVLMGDGNQREKLESLSTGIAHISFIQSLPTAEFQLALASADVLLVNELPGVKDMAVPSKLTSYFNAGIPVIAATDQGSVTAFEVQTSGGGVRVNAGDPAALLEAAEAISGEQASRAEMAENALRFRDEILSERAAIAKYDVFINRMASSRRR